MPLTKCKIAILPLDDRPCQYDYLQHAMKHVDEIEIVLPPRDILGHFLKAADLQGINQFLLEHADADYMIIALDALAYGSLVKGRTLEQSAEDCVQRLDILNQLHLKNPHLHIYAYSVLTRLTITVEQDASIEAWENIFAYSQLKYQVKQNSSLQKELDALIKKIDPRLLETYLAVRERNHMVNMAALQSVKDGSIEYLMIAQEDAKKEGIHLDEQTALKQRMHAYEINSQVMIKNGTDEMGALLLARCCMEILHPEVCVYIDKDTLKSDQIALYEDMPVWENVQKSFACAHVEMTNDVESANQVCLLLPHVQEQKDLCFASISMQPCTNEQLMRYAKYGDKPYTVLDLTYANGGSIEKLVSIMKTLPVQKCNGYSAWNTNSNAIGTLLLDIVIGAVHKTNTDYVNCRILDDAIYQGYVRMELNEWLKQQNIGIWEETSHQSTMLDYLNQQMQKQAQAFAEETGHILPDVMATLPWGRTFEVQVFQEETSYGIYWD